VSVPATALASGDSVLERLHLNADSYEDLASEAAVCSLLLRHPASQRAVLEVLRNVTKPDRIVGHTSKGTGAVHQGWGGAGEVENWWPWGRNRNQRHADLNPLDARAPKLRPNDGAFLV
jgi:hypothetical protein